MVMTMLYLMTSPEAVPVQIENALGSLLNSGPDDAHRDLRNPPGSSVGLAANSRYRQRVSADRGWMAITPELPQAARGSNSPGIIIWRPFIFAVSHALPEAVVNPADRLLSPNPKFLLLRA
jgi:hypothetical protein